MTKSHAIEQVIDKFDFQKVHEYMKRVNWTWIGTRNGVPSVPEMRNIARSLLVKVCKEECPGHSMVSTGGLKPV